MTDYNDGLFHPWTGGECPVHPKSTVEAIYRAPHKTSGFDVREISASQFIWKSDIPSAVIAFRVIKEHREPREMWLEEARIGWVESSAGAPGATLFREVLE